jgi:hypothetical protein
MESCADARIQVAMKACPYRKDFYAKLKADPAGGSPISDEKLNTDMNAWLDALHKIVVHMQSFYETNGYNKNF